MLFVPGFSLVFLKVFSALKYEIDLSLVAFACALSYLFSYLSMFLVLFVAGEQRWMFSFDRLREGFFTLKSLLHESLKFLVVQLSFVLLFFADRILILIFDSGASVAIYDFPARLFSLSYMIVAVCVSVFWVKARRAMIEKNASALNVYFNSLLAIFSALVILNVPVVIFADVIIAYWTGSHWNDEHNFVLLGLMVAMFLQCLGSISALFFNASGKLKVQFFVTIISICVKLLSFYIAFKWFDFEMFYVVILSTICSLSIWPIYSFFVIKMSGWQRLWGGG